jgi:hypothetical protein
MRDDHLGTGEIHGMLSRRGNLVKPSIEPIMGLNHVNLQLTLASNKQNPLSLLMLKKFSQGGLFIVFSTQGGSTDVQNFWQ